MSEPISAKALDLLAQAMFEQRAKIDEMSAKVTEENKSLMSLEAKFASHLKELDRKSYASPHGTVSLTERWSYKLPHDDEARTQFFDYLKELGVYDRMVGVNAATLTSFCKKQQEAADEEGKGFDFKIPGIEAPKLFETVSMRKA